MIKEDRKGQKERMRVEKTGKKWKQRFLDFFLSCLIDLIARFLSRSLFDKNGNKEEKEEKEENRKQQVCAFASRCSFV